MNLRTDGAADFAFTMRLARFLLVLVISRRSAWRLRYAGEPEPGADAVGTIAGSGHRKAGGFGFAVVAATGGNGGRRSTFVTLRPVGGPSRNSSPATAATFSLAMTSCSDMTDDIDIDISEQILGHSMSSSTGVVGTEQRPLISLIEPLII